MKFLDLTWSGDTMYIRFYGVFFFNKVLSIIFIFLVSKRHCIYERPPSLPVVIERMQKHFSTYYFAIFSRDKVTLMNAEYVICF